MDGNIGEIIKKLREKRDWSQRELARRIGMSYSVLSRIESGKRPVEDAEINLFADTFDVSADFLLGRSSNPVQSNETSNDNINFSENENLFFFNKEGLSEDDIEDIKKHIEFLRFKAKEHNEKNR